MESLSRPHAPFVRTRTSVHPPSPKLSVHNPPRTLLVALVLCVLLALSFANVIFLGATLLTSTFQSATMPSGPWDYHGPRVTPGNVPVRDAGATVWFMEPLSRLVARVYKAGQVPLWNPYAGAGTPLAANMQSGAFYIFNILSFLAPDAFWPLTQDIQALVGFFVAGFFTYLFVRQLLHAHIPALAAAIAYMLCGRLLFYIGTADFRVDTLLPVVLYATERLYRDPNPLSLSALAVTLAASILAGMPEATLFTILLSSTYYLYRTCAKRDAWTSPARAVRYITIYVAAAAFALLLSAPLLLLFLEYLANSWHAHGSTTGLVYYAPSTAISILVPYFLGGVYQGWGHPHLMDTMPYIGITTTLLAVLALLYRGPYRGHVAFLWVIAMLFILKSYGFPPLEWIGRLPLLNISVIPKYGSAAFAFCAACLAAFGLYTAVQRGISAIHAIIAAIGVVICIAVFTVVNLTAIARSNAWLYVGVQLLLAFGFLLVLVACILGLRQRTTSHTAMAASLTAILALELVVYAPKDRASRHEPFQEPPFVHYLRSDPEPHRVLGVGDILTPVTASAYGVSDIRMLDAIYPSRYVTAVKEFVDPGFTTMFNGHGIIEHTRVLDLLNVKYILAPAVLNYEWERLSLAMSPETHLDPEKPLALLPGLGATGIVLQPGRAGHEQPLTVDRSLSLPLTPERGFIRFDIGVGHLGDSPVATPQAAVAYEVTLLTSSVEQLIATDTLSGSSGSRQWRWQHRLLDVSRWLEGDATLRLTVRCLAPCAPDVVVVLEDLELLYLRHWSAGPRPLGMLLPARDETRSRAVDLHLIYNEEAAIYRNDRALPRAFLVHRTHPVDGASDAFGFLASPFFDPRREAVVESPRLGGVPPSLASNHAPDAAAATIRHETVNQVVVEVETSEPAFLVLTDLYYPGWTAYVDGSPATLYIADYLFRGVYIPAGRSTVDFRYEPETFRVGIGLATISVVAMTVMLIVWLAWPKLGRGIVTGSLTQRGHGS